MPRPLWNFGKVLIDGIVTATWARHTLKFFNNSFALMVFQFHLSSFRLFLFALALPIGDIAFIF